MEKFGRGLGRFLSIHTKYVVLFACSPMRIKNKGTSTLHNHYYNLVLAQAETKKLMYLLDSRLRGNDNPRVLYLYYVMPLSYNDII